MDFTHDDLVIRAERWLASVKCKVALREFRALTQHGEQPDAIGWMYGKSVLIECKATRSDFLSDKRKPFRRYPEWGMGDWRLYMCPKGVIQPADLPFGWGLLWVTGKQVRRLVGIPKGNCGWGQSPFNGNKLAETQVLVSALRRVELRGHLGDVYQPIEPVGVG